MAEISNAVMPSNNTTLTGERADLLAQLAAARYFLRFTVRDLTDEQIALRPTVSELCLGGLIKHVTSAEAGWASAFATGEAPMKNFDEMTEEDFTRRVNEFQVLPGETLAGILAEYEAVAAKTDELIAAAPDLDQKFDLPEAPWFQEKQWSLRRAVLHIIGETTQHAGHADIIREAIDGSKSMG